jgi:hypothetical protein
LTETVPVTADFYLDQLMSEGKFGLTWHRIDVYDGVQAEAPPMYRDEGERNQAIFEYRLTDFQAATTTSPSLPISLLYP